MNIVDKINEYYDNNHTKGKNCWEKSDFYNFYKLTNDERGSLGEKFVSEWIHLSNSFVINEDYSNKNKKDDGHYDLKVNNKRIEIKTSCLSSNSWQHEPLYKAENNLYDIAIFLDFDPENKIFLSICSADELPLDKSNIMFGNKHGTLRKNKDDGYKLDFSKTTIKNLKKYNRCLEFDKNTPEKEIVLFIERILNELI